MINSENCAVILLAAGASSRLGRPKQLLPYKGQSLLANAVDAANDSQGAPVIVVLGANAGEMEREIDQKKVHTVVNGEWDTGIASSIRQGLRELEKIAPGTNTAILMVCDQPYVTGALLDTLIAKHKNTGKGIVASRYQDAMGTPALFHRRLFDDLLQLNGDMGAKRIFQQRPEEIACVDFEKGHIDVDTEQDYRALS